MISSSRANYKINLIFSFRVLATEQLSYVSMVLGVQSAGISGTIMMQVWSAVSWDSHLMVSAY